MRLVPPPNSEEKDLVYTPDTLAQHIINHYKPTGRVLDPCRGHGAFYNHLPEPKSWCEISEGRDFFQHTEPADWIISNPPWSKIRDFMLHSMKIAPNIVYLTTINHYSTRRRINDLKSNNFSLKEILFVPTPPKPWPQSGFQLGALHFQAHYTGPVTLSW